MSSSQKDAFTQIVYRQYLSMVAGKCNLDLRFQDDACPCTDGKVVIVPSECYEDGKRDELTAYVLHEAGHARFTDFSILKGLKAYEMEVLNTIEDVRIETRMCQMYQGAKGYLTKSLAAIMPEILKTLPEQMKKVSLLQRFTFFVNAISNTYSYAGMYNEIIPPYISLTEKGLKESFEPLSVGEALCAEIRNELKCVPLLQTTGECAELVRHLLKILEKYYPNSQGDSEGQSKDSQNQSQDKSQDESKGKGNGKSSKKDQQSSSNSGNKDNDSQNSTRSKSESGNGKKKAKKGSSPKSDSDNGNSRNGASPSFKEAMSRDAMQHQGEFNPLDRAEHLGVKEDRGISRNRSVNSVSASSGTFDSRKANRELGTEIVSEARKRSSKLVSALRSFVEAKADTDIDYVSSGSKVKTSRLYRVPTGSMKVFTRVSDDPESTNTAVCILVDTSGSMGSGLSTCMDQSPKHNNPLVNAEVATLSLYTALRNLTGTETVSTSVIAFPGLLASETPSYHHPRANRNALYIVRHGERLTPEIAAHFAEIEGYGGTPINSALEAASVDLMGVTDVTRRVVFIITDGEFDADENLVGSMRRNGIEIFGLSIDCGDAERMKTSLGEKYTVTVNDSGAITPALVSLARKAFV